MASRHFHVEYKLARSSVRLQKTGASIYALSVDETSPAFVESSPKKCVNYLRVANP